MLSPFDVSFDGLSSATAYLRSLGVAVTQSWRPLSELLLESDPCGRVLVLAIAMQREYGRADLTAVRSFMDRGGGVLVLAEADNVFMSSDFQNFLLEHHGMKVVRDLRGSLHHCDSGASDQNDSRDALQQHRGRG